MARAYTLLELLAYMLIAAFILAAAGMLYVTASHIQTVEGYYSNNQTDLRTALHSITRTLRHGYSIQNPSVRNNLAGKKSTGSQVIVRVPQPFPQQDLDVMFWLDAPSHTVYYQRDTDNTPTAVVANIQLLTFRYFQTVPSTGHAATSATTTPVDATPQNATEVEITLTALRQYTATPVTAYVALRNASPGM